MHGGCTCNASRTHLRLFLEVQLDAGAQVQPNVAQHRVACGHVHRIGHELVRHARTARMPRGGSNMKPEPVYVPAFRPDPGVLPTNTTTGRWEMPRGPCRRWWQGVVYTT